MIDLIKSIEQYFDISEFVSQRVNAKYGRNAWKFFDKELLENILFIRENLDRPMTINNWKWAGRFQQRGLRENLSGIVSKKTKNGVLYLSAHVLGKAIDFDVKGMTALEVRNWIRENQSRLPYKARLENKVNWVHLDTGCNWNQHEKLYSFNP